MRKSLIALSAAAALGAASIAAPSPAQAHAWWIVPAIVGGVLIGGTAIAAATTPPAYSYSYGPDYYYPGSVSVQTSRVQPAPTVQRRSAQRASVQRSCRIVRERVAGGWNRYEVCR